MNLLKSVIAIGLLSGAAYANEAATTAPAANTEAPAATAPSTTEAKTETKEVKKAGHKKFDAKAAKAACKTATDKKACMKQQREEQAK